MKKKVKSVYIGIPSGLNWREHKYENENMRLCRMLDYLNRYGFEIATLVIGSIGATLCIF